MASFTEHPIATISPIDNYPQTFAQLQ